MTNTMEPISIPIFNGGKIPPPNWVLVKDASGPNVSNIKNKEIIMSDEEEEIEENDQEYEWEKKLSITEDVSVNGMCQTEGSSVMVSKHLIDEQFTRDQEGKPKWSAFDISYHPNWRKIIAYNGGLSNESFAIVRLIDDINGTVYITLYVRDTFLSENIQGVNAKIKEARDNKYDDNWIYNQIGQYNACRYPESAFNSPQFVWIANCFKYCFNLGMGENGGGAEFNIVEEVLEKAVEINGRFPKTNIRQHFNIFSDQPVKTFTNEQRSWLVFNYETRHSDRINRFVIRLKRD